MDRSLHIQVNRSQVNRSVASILTRASQFAANLADLCDLKPSQNTQFQDRPGACRLMDTAVNRGDHSMTSRLAECLRQLIKARATVRALDSFLNQSPGSRLL